MSNDKKPIATLLVVDDDIEIRSLLSDYLSQYHYRVLTAADGEEMRRMMAREVVDMLILDLMLPGEDGFMLCAALRRSSRVPVLMLTASNGEADRIVGLEMGADDYLAKPFSARELLARVKAILRRCSGEVSPTAHRFREFATFRVDTLTRELIGADGAVKALGSAEYRLLAVFLDYPQQVLSRDQLLQMTRGIEAMPFDRSIDAMISRLRQHLGDDARDPILLRTLRGEGYVLAASVSRL